MKKQGRNELCQCGSGKKFKRCHGLLIPEYNLAFEDKQMLKRTIDRINALSHQKTKQQGHGKKIISTDAHGTRFIAVNNNVYYSKKWKTFSDFLGHYIKIKIGSEWGNNEIKNKPDDMRHHILVWYQKICLLQQKHCQEEGLVYQAPLTGAVKAYYGLAYDLYCLEHNVELQQTLIARLKNADQNFYGVRYEIAVAAIMIRAGFTIEFEDESDRSKTHCEFTAKSKLTGKCFSVECKHLESLGKDNEVNLKKLGKRFVNALSKKANHTRIVFIDLNFPYNPKVYKEYPTAMDLAKHRLRMLEENKANGENLPPAYVFLTNHPCHLHLDDEVIGFSVLMDGFKIPEFNADIPRSLHDAIDIRERHIDLIRLSESIEKFSVIPTTFDGEIPEFSYNPEIQKNRLLIGERFVVPDSDGNDCIGELEEGFVNQNNKAATCIFRLENGSRVIIKCDLSDEELKAYQSHPDTFFGTVNPISEREASALELYDFFLESFKDTSKDILLGHFSNALNIDELKQLSQEELARLYAEYCTNSVITHN